MGQLAYGGTMRVFGVLVVLGLTACDVEEPAIAVPGSQLPSPQEGSGDDTGGQSGDGAYDTGGTAGDAGSSDTGRPNDNLPPGAPTGGTTGSGGDTEGTTSTGTAAGTDGAADTGTTGQ